VSATEFRVLGPVAALDGGQTLPLGGPKQRALLAELLLHRGGVVPRTHLVDAVWGERPPESAHGSLQVYVHGLRRVLGPHRIETNGAGYRLVAEPDEVDVDRFERLVDRGSSALAAGRAAEAEEELSRALDLWSGAPLADIADQPVAQAAAPRLEELRLRALELRIEALLALGEHAAAIPELEQLVAEQPFRERLREQHVLALYRAGRQKEALDAYRAARRALVDELGVEPGPALQDLERAILRQDDALASPVSPPREQAELPVAPTPLVGRRLELAAVEALLRRDDGRLVTLTGPGGTGKTRVALAVAHELAGELRDGACFVDLSAVAEEELILPTIARALGIPDTEDPFADLRDRSILLVLDNLEQLGERVSPIARLVSSAPRVRVLATSRTPLRLAAEQEYPVPPLPVPSGAEPFEQLAVNDAVRLFLARAQAADPGFALTEETATHVATICRRLDGLPLALELAAARTRSLSVAAIARRLHRALELLVEGARDLPVRQRTLRATLDWSYSLLPEEARGLLARLSVFVGGWTLDDLEAVVGDEALPLGALVDASLVRLRGDRYVQLETVRAYGLERLHEYGEEGDLRRSHALHFADRAQEARQAIIEGGDGGDRAYRWFADEEENLRAALSWAVDHGDRDTEVSLCESQRWVWLVSGRLSEGRRAFAHAAEAASGDPRLSALAAHGGATFALHQGDLGVARAGFERALEIFRSLGDREWAARSMAELGATAVADGDLERAREVYEECAALFAELGDGVKGAVALGNLAAIAARQGEAEKAAEFGRRAIELQRRNESRDDLCVTLANLARVLLALGEHEEARSTLREAIELATRVGYQLVLAHALGAAAEVAALRRDARTSARLLGASAAMFQRIGAPIPEDEQHEHEQTRARLALSLDDVELDRLVAEGAAAPQDAMIDEALVASSE
jgi:predicted ATPase/DNA-binding SARP family transcriptional activator